MLAPVNTVVYGELSQGSLMADQLSAQDWLHQGLKVLAKNGFTALKAEPLAKAMGVSRGSFYWHFADIGVYHAAILKHWRDVAAEQVIANLEMVSKDRDALALLLRQAFSSTPALENAVRTWATVDPAARAAVQAIDQRRLGYIETLLRQSGLSADLARARAQILYWTFLGFALSDETAAAGATRGGARRIASDRRAIKRRRRREALVFGASFARKIPGSSSPLLTEERPVDLHTARNPPFTMGDKSPNPFPQTLPLSVPLHLSCLVMLKG